MSAKPFASPLVRPAAVLAGLVGLVLAACAKVGPPPGGPEDRDAPAVLSDAVRPPPGAANVAPGETVMVVFSEPPDRRSVLRALAVFPPVDFRETSWQGDTLRLVPEPGWAIGRNTILRIGSTAHDRRGNPLVESFVLRFTTKAVPDSGTIRGRVWAGREKTSTARLIVFAIPADSAWGGAPAALAEPDKNGGFALEGLDTAASWRLAGVIDADGDARGDGRGEVEWRASDVTSFAPETREVTVPDFLVGTLDSVGHLRGEARADSGRVVYVVARDVGTGAIVRTGPLAGGGAFTLDVTTGARYRIGAYVDEDGDGERGESEPWVEGPEDLRLDLVAERTGVSIDLRTRAAEAPLAPADSIAPGNGTAAPREESAAPDTSKGAR